VGPPAVGKSTAALRLTLARSGIGLKELLGYPVTQADKPILYIAADRPLQIRRSLHRMVKEADRAALDKHVLFHAGPLDFDVAQEPARLAEWCTELGVGTIVLDSLKDLAVDLSKDETGSRVNRALGLLVGAGVEVLVNHHQRKASSDNRKPSKLADVYGSTWLTAGAGSVLLLWGQPGDPVLAFRHLKTPVEEVGPFAVELHQDGQLTVHREAGDLLSILRNSGKGATVKDAARMLYSTENPSKAEVEKTRRKLEALVRRKLAYVDPGGKGGSGGGTPARYFATIPDEAVPPP